jgi:hypothetical protein
MLVQFLLLLLLLFLLLLLSVLGMEPRALHVPSKLYY